MSSTGIIRVSLIGTCVMENPKSFKKYIAYLRNSIIDGTSASGDITSDCGVFFSDQLKDGLVPSDVVKTLFAEVKPEIEIENVMIFAKVVNPNQVHAVKTTKNKSFASIIISARLNRAGNLSYADVPPLIPRDRLEPGAQNDSIGLQDDFDSFLSTYPLQDEPRWKDVMVYADRLFSEVCVIDSQHFTMEASRVWIRRREGNMNMVRQIVNCYDAIASTSEDLPLLNTFSGNVTTNLRPLIHIESTKGWTNNSGHMDFQFPLADAQRDAVHHFQQLADGEILAVNGPPGTGKTTFLQSAVASLIVQGALKQRPIVIGACAATKQAVTNIIDSFTSVKEPSPEQNPLAGRWLPDLKSYGLYLAKNEYLTEAEAMRYVTPEWVNTTMENVRYVSQAEIYFIEKYQLAGFNGTTIEQAITELHKKIKSVDTELLNLGESWNNLQTATLDCQKLLNPHAFAEIESTLASQQLTFTKRCELMDALNGLKSRPSGFWDFLPWQKRQKFGDVQRVALYFGIDLSFHTYKTYSIDELIIKVRTEISTLDKKLHSLRGVIAHDNQIKTEFNQATNQWLRQSMQYAPNISNVTPSDIMPMLDTRLRYSQFRLAIHYFEAKWIDEVKSTILVGDEDKKSISKLQRKWRRQAMLFPCMVSTFHAMPNWFSGGSFDSKKNWITQPMFNFMDLLIVDEAGQATPEVAGAAFSLAKRALVVGDTQQIEPVWSVKDNIDKGNMIEAQLISCIEDFDEYEKQGRTASSGSVMKIAQHASPFHYAPKMERGMYLYEHRRCVNNIIQFCNDLCYQGVLVPKRGAAIRTTPLPEWGYGQVMGFAEKNNDGWGNEAEAEAIYQFILTKKDILEKFYAMPIGEIVAVITPYRRQRKILEQRMNVFGLKVGTVHVLQGAERPVVIFSPVHTRSATGTFIDRSSNMLNVAVSRAKDSFLVIGDMDTLNETSLKPSGMLARYLFTKGLSLNIPQPIIKGWEPTSETDVLKTVFEHDAFMRAAFRDAEREVVLLSPWITDVAMRTQRDLLQEINLAIKSGVKVQIYTDAEKLQSKEHKIAVHDLTQIGCNITTAHRVHAKQIFVDDKYFCYGSYNWLSAARSTEFQEYNTSIVVRNSAKTMKEKEDMLSLFKGVNIG